MLKGFAVKCEMVGTRFSANKLEASVCGAQLENGEMVKGFSWSSNTLESVSLTSVGNVRTEPESDPLPGHPPLFFNNTIKHYKSSCYPVFSNLFDYSSADITTLPICPQLWPDQDFAWAWTWLLCFSSLCLVIIVLLQWSQGNFSKGQTLEKYRPIFNLWH